MGRSLHSTNLFLPVKNMKPTQFIIVPTILLPQWSAWAAVQLPCSGSPGSSLRQRHRAMWCTHQRSGRRQCPQVKADVAMEGPSKRSVHHILDQPQPRPPPPPSRTWLQASNHSTPLGSRPIRSRLVAKRSAWKAWPSSYVPTLNQLDTDKTSILSTKDWIEFLWSFAVGYFSQHQLNLSNILLIHQPPRKVSTVTSPTGPTDSQGCLRVLRLRWSCRGI